MYRIKPQEIVILGHKITFQNPSIHAQNRSTICTQKERITKVIFYCLFKNNFDSIHQRLKSIISSMIKKD